MSDRSRNDDLAGAPADFDRAIENDPTLPHLYHYRAMVHMRANRVAETRDFEEALRLGPDTWPRRKSVEEVLLRARAKLKKNE